MELQNNDNVAPVRSSVPLPEWAKMRDDGWVFTYDQKTRFLGAEHPNGGKFSIANFECHVGDRETLAHQIGATIATILND